MNFWELLRKWVIHWEGWRNWAYRDNAVPVQHPTIGIGFNMGAGTKSLSPMEILQEKLTYGYALAKPSQDKAERMQNVANINNYMALYNSSRTNTPKKVLPNSPQITDKQVGSLFDDTLYQFIDVCRNTFYNWYIVDRRDPGSSPKEREVRVFPNPASDVVTVDYGFTDWSKQGEISLEITNELGQMVWQQKLPHYSGLQRIDVSKYSSGFYNTYIKRNNQVVATSKFAKQ